MCTMFVNLNTVALRTIGTFGFNALSGKKGRRKDTFIFFDRHKLKLHFVRFQVWDDELAATAQRWADQCVPAHDRASQRDVLRFPVGQNIAATWTTRPPSGPEDSQPEFGTQINAWFDEVRIYGFKPISGGHGTGHYSQVRIT